MPSNFPSNMIIENTKAYKRLPLPVLQVAFSSLQWRHNGDDGIPNHQPHHCLLNRLLGHRSKKTSMLCVTGLCAGNSPGPVTRRMFPFDDVIMLTENVYFLFKCHLSLILEIQLIKVSIGPVNTLRPKQYGHHFPDDIFKSIFLNEKFINFFYDFTEVCS